ncbi:MAG: V-type ATPase 116kDa subunit family protein [Bacillota bacterium]|nr:V-type ATPase 116kDa subunit family protein [Bacillota bacterium]
MAVEKMKLVNIIAPISEFDNLVDKYIIEHDVHPEDTREVMGDINGLFGFEGVNPYAELYKDAMEICEIMNVPAVYEPPSEKLTTDEAEAFIGEVRSFYNKNKERREEIARKIYDNNILLEQLALMRGTNAKLEELFNFKFIKFRFGKMKKEAYTKLETFMGDINAIFIKNAEDKNYVYGMYLTPKEYCGEVDNIFASLNFERIKISGKAKGTPSDAYRNISDENIVLIKQLESVDAEIEFYRNRNAEKVKNVFSVVSRKYSVMNTCVTAAKTKTMFVMSDWMPEKESDSFTESINKDDNIIVQEQDPKTVAGKVTPPTKLKHNFFSKPFEMFLSMYGTPDYDEIDPTAIMAVTFSIIFGMMYGDVGQGLILAIGGFALYKWKHFAIAGIMALAGVFSVVFGFLFGSIFGNESLIHYLWLNPMKQTQNLLVTAVAIGAVFMVMAMALNVANSLKKKDYASAFCSQNGVAGIVFYCGLLVILICRLAYGIKVPVWITLPVILVPVVLIFLKEAMEGVFEGKGFHMGSVGEYCMVNGFEMFDVMLTYITNTISYIRLGAFALVHAGMMMVVYQLAGMVGANGSMGYTAVLIFGNMFVMAMEAFIVCIQVLRLEFYEMMGRYYDGNGKPFVSVNIKNK